MLLFALTNADTPDVPPRTEAQTFAADLRRSSAFAEVVIIGDSATENELGRQVFEHRFEWLLPSWLAQREREFARTNQPERQFPAWLATRAATDLE